MQEVNLVKTTLENYYKAPTHDANNIYFTTDTRELFVGDIKYGSATIVANNTHPLPARGREGYLYIDTTGGIFSIKVWDETTMKYITLPLADTSYVKSIGRRDQNIVSMSGEDIETSSAPLDDSIDISDIDSLFD